MGLKEGEKLTDHHPHSYEHPQNTLRFMSFSPSDEHLEGPSKLTIFFTIGSANVY